MNEFVNTVILGNLYNIDDPSTTGNQASVKFQRDLKIGNNLYTRGDLILGVEEVSTTTIEPIETSYTDTGGNIIFKINGVTYTITPSILSYLSTLSSNAQTQITDIATNLSSDTANIQSQIDSKAGVSNINTFTELNTFNDNITFLRNISLGTSTLIDGVYTDSGNITFQVQGIAYSISTTKLSYLKNVTSSIQAQINDRASLDTNIFTGTQTFLSNNIESNLSYKTDGTDIRVENNQVEIEAPIPALVLVNTSGNNLRIVITYVNAKNGIMCEFINIGANIVEIDSFPNTTSTSQKMYPNGQSEPGTVTIPKFSSTKIVSYNSKWYEIGTTNIASNLSTLFAGTSSYTPFANTISTQYQCMNLYNLLAENQSIPLTSTVKYTYTFEVYNSGYYLIMIERTKNGSTTYDLGTTSRSDVRAMCCFNVMSGYGGYTAYITNQSNTAFWTVAGIVNGFSVTNSLSSNYKYCVSALKLI